MQKPIILKLFCLIHLAPPSHKPQINFFHKVKFEQMRLERYPRFINFLL